MKKLLSILSLAVALCASAFAADAPSPAVLAQSTRNGVTTVITTGRVQAEAMLNADGTVTFTVYPTVTLLDSTGAAIAPAKLDTANGFSVALPVDLVGKILVEVKAAYLAKLAAEAAAKTEK